MHILLYLRNTLELPEDLCELFWSSMSHHSRLRSVVVELVAQYERYAVDVIGVRPENYGEMTRLFSPVKSMRKAWIETDNAAWNGGLVSFRISVPKDGRKPLNYKVHFGTKDRGANKTLKKERKDWHIHLKASICCRSFVDDLGKYMTDNLGHLPNSTHLLETSHMTDWFDTAFAMAGISSRSACLEVRIVHKISEISTSQPQYFIYTGSSITELIFEGNRSDAVKLAALLLHKSYASNMFSHLPSSLEHWASKIEHLFKLPECQKQIQQLMSPNGEKQKRDRSPVRS